MKRFIFLSVLFVFIGTIGHAQMVKPNKVQVEKKPVATASVDKTQPTQTRKAKLPTTKMVTTRISMQATDYKKRMK